MCLPINILTLSECILKSLPCSATYGPVFVIVGWSCAYLTLKVSTKCSFIWSGKHEIEKEWVNFLCKADTPGCIFHAGDLHQLEWTAVVVPTRWSECQWGQGEISGYCKDYNTDWVHRAKGKGYNRAMTMETWSPNSLLCWCRALQFSKSLYIPLFIWLL